MQKNLLWFLLCLPLCIACSKTEEDLPQRTVLIYMAADNNLYKNAQKDIAEMLAYTTPIDGNLIVYLDAPSWSADAAPQLLQIKKGKTVQVKQYEPQNSASGEVLQSVINDAVSMFPARSYGLVLYQLRH